MRFDEKLQDRRSYHSGCQEIISFHKEYLFPLIGVYFCTELAMPLNSDVDRCMKLVMLLDCGDLPVIMRYDMAPGYVIKCMKMSIGRAIL